jgi:glycosyltransferase involved in cell wall biosynthesis
MTNQPLVTLGLPTYNGAATTARALDTLVAQDYPNIELLIADDASSDETPSICDDYARRYNHIRFQRNASNLGAYGNFLKLLRQARGKYYVWVSQDDEWHPRFVSTLVAILENNPEAIVAQGATRFFWEDTGEEAFTVHLSEADWPQNQSHLKAAISLLTKRGDNGAFIKNSIFMHGVLRLDAFKSVIDKFPGIFSNERQVLCHLALAGRLDYVDQVLFMKQARRGSRVEYYPDDPVSKLKLSSSRFRKLRYIWQVILSISGSSIVPFHRKFYLPIIAACYLHASLVVPAVHRCAYWIRENGPRPLYRALKKLRS